jgi:hypothetical protein
MLKFYMGLIQVFFFFFRIFMLHMCCKIVTNLYKYYCEITCEMLYGFLDAWIQVLCFFTFLCCIHITRINYID